MKKIVLASLLAIITMVTGCKKEEVLSARDQTLNKLNGQWSNAQVTHGTDGDLSGLYADFQLVFTKAKTDGFDGYYIVSNGGHAFTQGSGKWKLDSGNSQITLSNGPSMDFEVTATALMLDFTVENTGGRISGLHGHFTFNLTKE